jgi:hypothetical protein
MGEAVANVILDVKGISDRQIDGSVSSVARFLSWCQLFPAKSRNESPSAATTSSVSYLLRHGCSLSS